MPLQPAFPPMHANAIYCTSLYNFVYYCTLMYETTLDLFFAGTYKEKGITQLCNA